MSRDRLNAKGEMDTPDEFERLLTLAKGLIILRWSLNYVPLHSLL
jgi:hypothetical protein